MINRPFTENQLFSLIEELKRFSADSTELGKVVTEKSLGTTRLAYSQEDEQAHRFISQQMQAYGLKVRQDPMGNIFARLAGQCPELPAVATGSHLDTVPQGGAYDGIVGVVSGLYALLQFKPQQLKRDLELILFRAEESSRFAISCIGSKAMAGKVDEEKWHTSQDSMGKTLFQAIDEAGYNSQQLNDCLLPADYLSAFVELHIEQGKCLEATEKKIGIVTGIAAPTRFRIDVHGHADHSGATPMNQRQDALVVSAELISEIHRLANIESTYGSVATVGKLEVRPNSINVIPGHVRFFVDIRGIEPDSIQRIADGLHQAINLNSQQFAVEVKSQLLSQESPVKLNPAICQVIKSIAEQKKISHNEMLSGAGHDAMYMATRFPTGMIFIPSKKGISHHHEEYSSPEDILIGAELLSETLASLANR